jgi:hypothetical protein
MWLRKLAEGIDVTQQLIKQVSVRGRPLTGSSSCFMAVELNGKQETDTEMYFTEIYYSNSAWGLAGCPALFR